jgi:uncharacterized protein HemX
MPFKPATWFRIAVALTIINLVGAGFAAGQAQTPHAAIHVVLALGFGWWASRLRQRTGKREVQAGPEAVEALEAIQALEADVSQLRQELNETQERLDFAERMLAQGAEARRMGPQRQDPK